MCETAQFPSPRKYASIAQFFAEIFDLGSVDFVAFSLKFLPFYFKLLYFVN